MDAQIKNASLDCRLITKEMLLTAALIQSTQLAEVLFECQTSDY